MKTHEEFFPHLGNIMSAFYEEMLRHKVLSVFFNSEQAIVHLISLQTKNFKASVHESDVERGVRFKRSGETHYDLRVPSADFMKSTTIWRTHFFDYAKKVVDVVR